MHVAIICHELTSRFNTSLEFADRLQASGHRVTYVTHADVGDVVKEHGHGFVVLSSTPAKSPRLIRPPLLRLIPWIFESRRARNATAADDEIERAVTSVGPDIILIDIEMHYAAIAVARLPIPAALYMNFFSIYRLPGIPPLNSQFVPSGRATDAAQIRLAWRRNNSQMRIRRLSRKLGRAMVGDLLRPISYTTYHYADLKAVAKERGVVLSSRSDRTQWLEPLTFTDLPVLSFTANEMEFPHEPHPNMRYVGPMIPGARSEPRADQPFQKTWDAFDASMTTAQQSGPVVYCSLGSYVTDADLLLRIVNVFRRRPEWRLVVGLGHKAKPEDLGQLPKNVLAMDWAPQLDVLAIADVAITHGGTSSVHECIANAVPMLVYALDRDNMDRAGNAARVLRCGAGLRGDVSTDRSTDIEGHLERLISDPSFRQRAVETRDVLGRYRSDDTAVKTLEGELRSGTLNFGG
ncbi:MAG: nucleotide disphospho-sugar-binding domain-containing protein [Acidimicrobiia bacterium]